MKSRGTLFWYVIIFLLSLGAIFFLHITPNSTGGRSYSLGLDGWKSFRKGMDVAGGVRLNYKIDLNKYKQAYTNPQEYTQVTRNVKNIILQNIDSRISKLGVSDYESYLQTIGEEEFIIIEIGGVSDLDQAKAIIGKTVELEFKTAYSGTGDEMKTERKALVDQLVAQAKTAPTTMQDIATPLQSDQVYFARHEKKTLEQLPDIYTAHTELFTSAAIDTVQLIDGVYAVIPPMSGLTTTETSIAGWTIFRLVAIDTLTGATDASGAVAPAQTVYTLDEIMVEYFPAWVPAKDPLTNDLLNGAYFKFASVSQSQTGQPVATITFDDKGKEIFCNLTEKIVGQPLAIFVGGTMITSPTIREKICGGSAQIDGQFTPASAAALVSDLNEGAFPATLILANEEKVSPKLGETALQGALYAGVVGLLFVFIYMTTVYGIRYGLSSLATLLFFLAVLFACLKLIGFAVSLSGLAAILLSIGMGVDANILIYERIREEEKSGSKGREAIELGYARSWSAIRDGNLTTLLIGVLLLFVGTNIFKGFGTMLILTILLTLFTMVPLIRQIARSTVK